MKKLSLHLPSFTHNLVVAVFMAVGLLVVSGGVGVGEVDAIYTQKCTDPRKGADFARIEPDRFASGSIDELEVSIDVSNFPNGRYRIRSFNNKLSTAIEETGWQTKNSATQILTFKLTGDALIQNFGELGSNAIRTIYLDDDSAMGNADKRWCTIGTYTVEDNVGTSGDKGCKFTVWQDTPNAGGSCYYPNSCMEGGTNINIKLENLQEDGQPFNGVVVVRWGEAKWGVQLDAQERAIDGTVIFKLKPDNNQGGIYSINSFKKEVAFGDKEFEDCDFPGGEIEVSQSCSSDECDTDPQSIYSNSFTSEPYKLCAQINDPAMFSKCKDCSGDAGGQAPGVWTAVGCVPTNSSSMIRVVIKIGLSVSGGIALLMILAASFMLSTSQGDPKKTNDAKDMLSSAIMGLMFIIFSITMLQFIGVKVLQIPGFGT